MAWADITNSLRAELNEAASSHIVVVIRGAPYECWRCQAANEIPLVLHLDELTRQDCCFPVHHPSVLPYMAELLQMVSHPAASVVKPRYSKSVGHRYLSLGCSSCDALFGMFPLSEEYVDYAVEDRISSLPIMARLERPALEWWTLEGVRSNLLDLAVEAK